MPRVKVGMSCGKGDEEGERGQTRQTHYSSWKDPSINKDFTPGHFFKKRSLICKEQEKHFHNYNERCRYKFDFDARDWEAAASKQGSNSEEASELIDSRWWGRRRFLTPRWQSPPPYAGSQRTWCTGTEAGRKEGRHGYQHVYLNIQSGGTVHPIYFILGRFVADDRRKCSVEFGGIWTLSILKYILNEPHREKYQCVI